MALKILPSHPSLYVINHLQMGNTMVGGWDGIQVVCQYCQLSRNVLLCRREWVIHHPNGPENTLRTQLHLCNNIIYTLYCQLFLNVLCRREWVMPSKMAPRIISSLLRRLLLAPDPGGDNPIVVLYGAFRFISCCLDSQFTTWHLG